MKKTFQLTSESKNPERLLEAIKHEIRKYIQRERRRALPEGVDYWDFDCQFGPTQEAAAMVHLAQIIPMISATAAEGAPQFYVEILAKHGHRNPRAPREDADADSDA